MKDKVSVIIPTYNREKTIENAIQSVLNQTYTNLEVLVIDDGSTDGTADIVKGIKNERVKYIALKKNGGASNARNVGVEMASGEWIAFQDSDDYWHSDKLEKQMEYYHSKPKYSLIYCMSNVDLGNNRYMIVPTDPLPEITEGNMLSTLLCRNLIDTPTMLMKKESFLEVGGFDTTYHALEDWEFVIRFASKYQIGFCTEVLMDSYMLSDGVSSNIGAYFEARCKMLGQYKNQMALEGVLESIMQDILLRADKEGVLESVKKIMMLYLSK